MAEPAAIEHGVNCGPGGEGLCVRCSGFEPGNEHRFERGNGAAVKHAAYSPIRLGPRAEELADGLREVIGRYRPADEVLVQLLGLTLARIEAAAAAINALDTWMPVPVEDEERNRAQQALKMYLPDFSIDRLASDLQRLRDDVKGWVRLARSLSNDLGMSPTSRARMGLDLAATARALNVHDLAAAALELDGQPAQIEEGAPA